MPMTEEYILKLGLIKLLEIKDSDIRIMTLQQADDSIDRSIHIGGAFSATIPLVALYYGGMMKYDIVNPTNVGQDMFILSKGHSVATVASIFADIGYFDHTILKNSRGESSILNGHPGPILPGFHISTGPLGQGLSVAEGLALIGKKNPRYDVFCLTGDGELQEGTIWEAVMYSGYKKLDNLCLLIDFNSGQIDDTKQLVVPILDLEKKLACFGWKVITVNGTLYDPVINALESFKYLPREGKPIAIICRTRKGYGGFSSLMGKHKITLVDGITEQELQMQDKCRNARTNEFLDYFNGLSELPSNAQVQKQLINQAHDMNLQIVFDDSCAVAVEPIIIHPRIKQASERNKRIQYDECNLPKFELDKEYTTSEVITSAMKVFARDPRVVSIDADLGVTSGLESGVGYVDVTRAFNVGVAESNMMGIGEAFAVQGYNSWVSTFCPFFDWRVLRRIAIGHQERLEAISMKDGWLNEGHGLDITFVAQSPNFETTTNGATHMGNDDESILGGIAQLKIIDTSCPRQLLGVMEWIMEGNKGLVYLRIMRSSVKALYNSDFNFEYSKGYILRESPDDLAIVVSSGHGVHEALAAADILISSGCRVGVVDMPSIDEALLINLYSSGKPIIIAEQNNGFIWSSFQRILFRQKRSINCHRLIPINCLTVEGNPKFIHSATYAELLTRYKLSPHDLVEMIEKEIGSRNNS